MITIIFFLKNVYLAKEAKQNWCYSTKPTLEIVSVKHVTIAQNRVKKKTKYIDIERKSYFYVQQYKHKVRSTRVSSLHSRRKCVLVLEHSGQNKRKWRDQRVKSQKSALEKFIRNSIDVNHIIVIWTKKLKPKKWQSI